MASAYGVVILIQVRFERIRAATFYNVHATSIQSLYGLEDRTLCLFIISVIEPALDIINPLA